MNLGLKYGIIIVGGDEEAMVKKTFILITYFIPICVYAYAAGDSVPVTIGPSSSFSEWVNAESGYKPTDENAEKIILREQWKRNIGIDIFYPYFKAKQVESVVKRKASFRVFKIKGRPEFKDNEAKYIFRVKF